jgi:maltase-glucoamylase
LIILSTDYDLKDVQYIDTDYKYGARDFTIDQTNFGSLPNLIEETQRNLNLHWTPIIDPAVQGNDSHYNIFIDGYHQNVFIKWPKSVPMDERHNPKDVYTDRDTMYGRVWPEGPVAYPDFLKNVTQNWWVKNLQHLYSIGWKFDALWIVIQFLNLCSIQLII